MNSTPAAPDGPQPTALPPSHATLERLRMADGGYDTQDCLQALLTSGGNEDRALEVLRSSAVVPNRRPTNMKIHVQPTTPVPVANPGQPTMVVATVVKQV